MHLIPSHEASNYNRVITIIEAADLADSTKDKYRRVVEAYLLDGGRMTDRRGLVAYADTLSNSRRTQLKAAVKLWSNAMIQDVKARATPDNLAAVDASIHRFQALQTAVTVKTTKGTKAHTWLTRPEVTALMDATGDNARDRAALGLLVGAGLRRDEAVNLTFADIKEQPIKGMIRQALQVSGKGAKNRVVPISEKLVDILATWGTAVASSGFILRRVSKGESIGGSLSDVALFQIVRKYGRLIGKPSLAPHDLRRTYAQIGFESGIPITQISKLLGHESVATTQRYLNLDLNLETTISDYVPL